MSTGLLARLGKRGCELGSCTTACLGRSMQLISSSGVFSQADIDLSHLILQEHHPQARGDHDSRGTTPWAALRTLSSGLAFRLLTRLEQTALRWHYRYRDHEGLHDLSRYVTAVIPRKPPAQKTGGFTQSAIDTLGQVRDLDLDLIIDLGRIPPSPEMTAIPRLGVISLRYGADLVQRGDAPGFREVCSQTETTGFAIGRVTNNSSGWAGLRSGHIPTQHRYKLNQAALFEHAHYHLTRLVAEIAANDQLPADLPSVPYSGPSPSIPTTLECLRYCATVGWRTARKKAAGRLLGRDYRWSVGYVRSGWQAADFTHRIEIISPPGHDLADPFVISRDGRDYCFAEKYDYPTRLGRIVAYELTAQGATRLGTALAEPFHLSFPFLFEFEGGLFMCPETHQARDIRGTDALSSRCDGRWKLR